MRMIGAAVAVVAFQVGFAIAQAPSGSQPSSSGTADISVIGCIARTGDHFFLNPTATAFDAKRHSVGSNSAKASTPISGGPTGASRKASSGSSSPKGSTPLGTAASDSTRRTAGAMTAKGSVPIARPRSSSIAYELVADPERLSSEIGHVVEIAGTVVADSQPTAPGKLSVKRIKALSATCPK